MKKLLENKYLFPVSVLFADILFFILVSLCLPIRYGECDDVIMCMIASGLYTGVPDCHLVFVNAIYGWLISSMYKLTTAVEWYSVSFAILHVVSMTVVTCCTLKDKTITKIHKAVFLVFFYVLWTRIILSFQFTTTAGLTCFAGLLMLRKADAPPFSKCSDIIIGAALIIISSLIRFSSMGMIVLLFIPLILFDNGLHLKKYVPYIIIFFSVISLNFVDKFFYNTPEWKYYLEYNSVRSKIQDNPNTYRLDIKLPENVSYYDFCMFRGFEGDPNVMTLDVIKDLYDSNYNVGVIDKLGNLGTLNNYRLVTAMMAALYIVLIISIKNRKFKLVLSATLFVLLFVLIFLSLDHYVKSRVFVCCLFPVIYVAMASVSYFFKKKILYVFSVIIMLLISAKYVKQTSVAVSNYEDTGKLFSNNMKCLEMYGETKNIIMGLNTESLNPYKIHDELSGYNIKYNSWLSGCPLNRGFFESYLDYIDNEILLLNVDTDVISDCISDNYGVEAEAVVVAEYGECKLEKLVRASSTNYNDTVR